MIPQGLIIEWGEIMRMARRASHLAIEDARRRGAITDPLQSAILLYTDDPSTAGLFLCNPDMAEICNASEIEGICIAGEGFPAAAFEAARDDIQLPRVAAMWFPATGRKCPRCRKYTAREPADLCQRCASVVEHPAP